MHRCKQSVTLGSGEKSIEGILSPPPFRGCVLSLFPLPFFLGGGGGGVDSVSSLQDPSYSC